MGCFGKKQDKPVYKAPEAPKLPTAKELYGEGVSTAQGVAPLAFGAREGALGDLAKGTEFYEQFQPTSFEQALANQYFANVWPQTQETIKHGLSMSGMASSPILAEQLGKAQGQLGVDIGQYLSGLGQQRAQYSLGSRLGIDPYSMITPYVGTGMQQSTAQAGLNYEQAKQQAMADYIAQVEAYEEAEKQRQSKAGLFSTLGGVALGALTGGLAAPAMSMIAGPFAGMSAAVPWALGGGLMGGTLGSAVSPVFGGGEPTMDIGTMLALQQQYPDIFGFGGQQAESVYSSFAQPTAEQRRRYGSFGNF